jgi:type IV pilus assembly protein PilW
LDCTLLRVFNIISDVPYAPAINAVINDNASTVPPVSAVTLAGVKVPGSVVNAGETITSGVPAQPAWSKLALANALNVGFDSTQTPVFPPGGYPATSAALNTNTVLHNLGMTPVLTRTRFAVNTSAQFTRQINNATPEVVAENIVSLQAQYGIANAGQQSISCWVNPTGVNTNPASPTCLAGDTADWTMAGLQATPDNIKRIKAIRVAVVARNNLRQKATNGVCTTTITAPVSWLNGPAVDLSGNPDWRCYRYKVYQTIIPMNNVILGNV